MPPELGILGRELPTGALSALRHKRDSTAPLEHRVAA
jgi:hypothetical protein